MTEATRRRQVNPDGQPAFGLYCLQSVSSSQGDRTVARRVPSLALRVSTFLAGAILMSLEILGFRIIGKTFGSALRETSVVISVFMLAMCLGYFLGGRIADRRPQLRTFVFALVLAAATTVIIPWTDEALSERVFHSNLPLALHSTIVTIVLFFVPTVFLASVSPIAIRLVVSGVEKTGSTAGSISALSTFGSIVGSVGTAFLLIDYFESVHRTVLALSLLAGMLAAITALAGAVDAPTFGRWWKERRLALTVAVILMIGVPVLAFSYWLAQPLGLDAIRGGMEYGSEVVFEKDSTFHHIRVVDHNRLRTLYFDVAAQTQISLDDPAEGGFKYARALHLSRVVNPELRNMLLIGLGGGTVSSRFLRDYPEMSVDAVEIDPAVIEVAKDWFFVRESPRLRLFTDDGRAFIRRSTDKYDLIVLDAYSTNRYGASLPAHLATREFFNEAVERLTPNGLFAYNCAAPPEAEMTRALSKTLYRVLPYQFAVRAGNNTVLFGSRNDIRMEADRLPELIAQMRSAGKIRIPGLEEHLPVTLQYAGVPILTDDWAPVDRLMRERFQQGEAF
jgi:spermidine synthase